MKNKLLALLTLVWLMPYLVFAETGRRSLSVIFDNGEVRVFGGAKPVSFQMQSFNAAEVDSIDQVVVDYDTRLLYVRPTTDFRGRRTDVYRFGSRKRLMALPGVSRIVIPQGGKADVIMAFRFQPRDAKDIREADLFFEDFIQGADYSDQFILQTRRRSEPRVIASSKNYTDAPSWEDPVWASGGCYSDQYAGFLDIVRYVADPITFERKYHDSLSISGLDNFVVGEVAGCDHKGSMWVKIDYYQNDFVYVDAPEKKIHKVKGRLYRVEGRDIPAECFAVWSRSLLGCLAWNHEKKNIEYTEHSWRSEVTPTLEYHLEKAPLSMEAGDSFTVVGRDTALDCLYFTELEFMRLNMTRNGQQLFELCFAEKPIIREVPLGRVGRGQKVVGVYVE